MTIETVFHIKDEVRAKHPELVELIMATESMDDNERQYWFDLLPSMSDGNVGNLKTILETEKIKLAEVEKKYGAEIKELNRQHLIEWQDYEKRHYEEGSGILKDLTA